MIFSKKNLSLLSAAIFSIAAFSLFTLHANAMTPTLALQASGNGDGVQVTIVGDPNSAVSLYYISTTAGLSIEAIGSTDGSGNYSQVISTSQYSIAANAATYVVVDGQRSATETWPDISTASQSVLTFSQTSLVMTVGQSSTITVNNNTSNATLYVSNNSNPPIANVSVPNNQQITVSALSVGSAVVTICPLGNSTNCASIYLTVTAQNSSEQALAFTQNNVTVATGQTVPITVSGGNGVYTVLTNSNSSVITATVNGSTINLYAAGTSGTASVTICSTDMSSCGIITATVGTVSSTGITFSQDNPTLGVGQNLTISVSGGTGSYYIASNSNQSSVSANISSSNQLSLYGSADGSATITVCSSSGNCGTIVPTVNFVSTGGAMSLSQTSLTLLLGQTLSVTISGGEAPYSLANNNNSLFQSSLNNNVITITGLSAGSSVLSVCSAGGGCVGLSITVNGAGVGSSTLEPTFGQNNFSMTAGQSISVALTGQGDYYVSSNASPNIATAYISGTNAVITANSLGSTNITICQSGGECNVLSVNVISSSGSVSTAVNPTFTPGTVNVTTGQNMNVSISGGSDTSYYLASNSNPAAATVSISGSELSVSGETSGSSIAVVCATANNCSPLFITVNAQAAVAVITFTPTNPTVTVGEAGYVTLSGATSYYISSSPNNYFGATINGDILSLTGENTGQASVTVCSTNGSCVPIFVTVSPTVTQAPASAPTTNSYQFLYPIKYGETSTDVTELQTRLTQLGVYDGPITGYFGNLTLAAVKTYQGENGLPEVGNVGPETRALLNQ